MTSKVVSVTEATSLVTDGAHIALSGFAITRNCVAAVHELVRAERRGLWVSQVIGGIETDVLAAAGCIDRLTYSGGSLDRFGPLQAVNRGVADGRIAVEEYSSLSLTLRFHAGALGLPFVPTRSMLGSDLLEPLLASGDVRVEDDPFGGGPVALLAPLRPDVAFVHADAADWAGNAVVGGPTWAIRETAFAARAVVVVCEELVEVGAIEPERVLVPAAIVSAVSVVPRGAAPTAVLGRYDYHRAHLEYYAQTSRATPEAHVEYVDRFVRGTPDHESFLARLEDAA